MYPGKARESSSNVFKERVVNAGGVRFFAKYEKICRTACQGVDTTMTQILPICKKKLSEESTKNMILKFGTDENSARLDTAMLEISAVAANYGKIFAKTCYTL